MQFRYIGFSQQANMRCYRFEGVALSDRLKKTPNVEFALSADMRLIAEHSVRVQDLPSLCLQILTFALSTGEDNAVQFASYQITCGDLTAFAAAHKPADGAKSGRRKPRPDFKPSAASQLRWPRTE
jgi:hypothetical protein